MDRDEQVVNCLSLAIPELSLSVSIPKESGSAIAHGRDSGRQLTRILRSGGYRI